MSPGAPAGYHRTSSPNRHRPRPRRLLPPPALAHALLLLLLLSGPSSTTMTTTAAAFLLAPARRGRVLSLIGLRHQPAAAAAATAAASLLRHYHPHNQRSRGGRGSLQVTTRTAAAASTLSDAHPPRPRNETASPGAVGDQRPAPPTQVVEEEEEEEETEMAVFAALLAKLGSDESKAAEDEEEIDALLAPPPADQPRSVRFVISGDPQPLRRHRVANNRMYNPSAGEQKKFLEKARPFMPPRPLLGPLEATVIFRMKRPRSHYRSGRYAHLLKADVPRFHTARTDLDNLVKLVLDSLNEHAYEDDRQIVSVRAVKEYCNLGVGSTDVTLRVLEERAGGKWWEEEGEGEEGGGGAERRGGGV